MISGPVGKIEPSKKPEMDDMGGRSNQRVCRKAEIHGINSLVFDPCGNTPKGGDFISMMQQNVDNLRMAFQ